jgi:hypothetical protein
MPVDVRMDVSSRLIKRERMDVEIVTGGTALHAADVA